MPDDAGERTEQPTARRRKEARDNGDIAKSSDLTAATGMLVGMLLLQFLMPTLFGDMLAMTEDIGSNPEIRGAELSVYITRMVGRVGRSLVLFLLFLLLLSLVGSLAQTGLLVTWKKLKPDFKKLSPISGIKRIFSADSLAKLGFGLLKMMCVVAIAWITINGMLSLVLSASGLSPRGVLSLGGDLVFTLAMRLVLVLLILGLIDYFYQRWQTEKKLKMTKQEVKDEFKRMEGDPLIKQRRRQTQMQLNMQRLGAEVPKADVVVTNPTEYAVALQYDETSMAAPKVIAKGTDLLALRIRQLAQHHRIPVVQRPPLARGLYAACEVGDDVPPAYYKAVAELLAYVYRITGKLAS